jgi:4'-phosphopantetheinyl transferase
MRTLGCIFNFKTTTLGAELIMCEHPQLTPLAWSWRDPRPAPRWLDAFSAEAPVVWLAWATESDSAAGLRSLLSPEEQDRWARFRQDADRRRFLVGRGLLRVLAGAQMNLPPEQVELVYGPYGKPSIAMRKDRPPWHFNLSHSGDLVLLAFQRARQVGVDVEQVRADLDWDAVALRSFPADQYREWAALGAEDCGPAFFKNWTRREAGFKALGVGIAHGGQPDDRLTYFDLSLPPGYRGAAAIAKPSGCETEI